MAIATIRAATLTSTERCLVAVIAAARRRSMESAARSALQLSPDQIAELAWSICAKFGIRTDDDIRSACRIYINAQETH